LLETIPATNIHCLVMKVKFMEGTIVGLIKSLYTIFIYLL